MACGFHGLILHGELKGIQIRQVSRDVRETLGYIRLVSLARRCFESFPRVYLLCCFGLAIQCLQFPYYMQSGAYGFWCNQSIRNLNFSWAWDILNFQLVKFLDPHLTAILGDQMPLALYFKEFFFFRYRLNIHIFLPIVGWKYSCIYF